MHYYVSWYVRLLFIIHSISVKGFFFKSIEKKKLNDNIMFDSISNEIKWKLLKRRMK